MPGRGYRCPSEYRRFVDEKTGAVIHQLTKHRSINHNLYFLNNSFTPDDRTVVFTSYRDGNPNLYELALPDGQICQLTEGEQLHPFSACLSRSGDNIYFTRAGSVWQINRASLEETCLATFDKAQLGECNLSRSGEWVVTAIKQRGESGIAMAKTDGSSHDVVLRWPRTVIHPQFHPLDEQLIEFSSDPAPRMHLLDRQTGKVECLYEHSNEEFVVHETFLGTTEELVFTVWPFSLKRLDLLSRRIREIATFNAWHISPNADGTRVLCDTNHPDIGIQIVEVSSGARKTVCYPHSSNGGSQWKTARYALAEDWARAAEQQQVERGQSLSWMEMKTDTVYGPQWTHPHPSWSPDETQVIYTSDVSGFAQVYVAEIP
ncbi:MAG: oligogalacturonate lyase family protein [Acidobacteria bacterium]|nr:oligogalacturonate lyase family protein [Acidobacteriota bacterium]MCI0621274.1 oligogalacturonate lyase family protein [Acidobacteriota bacterium]MCI0719963.1 oligogalacturonate lyase family protein [Acidobacteriota bacterium]